MDIQYLGKNSYGCSYKGRACVEKDTLVPATLTAGWMYTEKHYASDGRMKLIKKILEVK